MSRLQSLRTPARFATGGGRVIAEVQDRDPLVQLLRAANETVLGRTLQFDSGIGASLTLDVAGRRVLRLAAAEGLPGAEDCLAAEALDDEHKDQLIKLLRALATPGFELSVTSGPMERGGETVSVGLPVALLADLLLLDLNEVAADEPDLTILPETIVEIAPPESDFVPPALVEVPDGNADLHLKEFAGILGPVLMAWIIIGGEDNEASDGPEEMVAHLLGFLGDEAVSLSHQLDLVSTAPGGPICLILGASLAEGHSIVCARSRDAMLLGLIDGDGTPLLLTAWGAAFR